MSMDLGDRTEDSTLCFHWSTNAAAGGSITRATDGVVSVYKDDSDTQSTEGVTDTEDFDSLTGIHMCKIVLTNAFYAAGSDYSVILSAATIDGETVNAVLATFSIENRFVRGTDSAALAATALTDATWTDTRAGYLDELAAANLPTDISNLENLSAAEAEAACDAAFATYDPPTDTEMVAAFTEIKGATWAAGTDTMEHIRNKQTDIETDTAEIGAAGVGLTAVVWNADWDAEVQSECADALTAYDPPTKAEMDTAHGLLATEAKQDVSDSNIVLILADTAELQTDNIPGTLAVLDGKIDTVDGKIVALNDISTAEVNTEMDTVLKTDTISEQAQGVPPTTPTFEEAIMYLYMALTKQDDMKTSEDPNERQFYNNAGTLIWKKLVTDDGTDYSEAKGITGA